MAQITTEKKKLGGALIISTLDNGLTQFRVASFFREILVALIVLALVVVAVLSKRQH